MDKIADNYILFRFVPTMRCNYRCEYCFLENDTKSGTATIFDQYTPEQWIQAMGRYSNKKVEFYMWGGEPFVLDGTYQLVRGWTGYDHVISGSRIDTNMFFAEKIAQLCPTGKVKLNCSWHTQYDTFESIYRKANILNDIGMVGMLNFVASNQNLNILKDREGLDLDELINRFDDVGIFVNIAADFSIVNGKNPSTYVEYEKLIRKYVCLEDWQQLRGIKKPVMCDANKHFFTVHANGDITPCLTNRVCGNFFDGTLNPPPVEECCNDCPSIVAYPFRRDNFFPFRGHLPEYVMRNREYRKSQSNRHQTFFDLSPQNSTANLQHVSIVLPTYNHLSFLPKSIESMLSQTFTNFELIIVNDGSTDGTREFLDSLSDPRIRVIHQANKRLPGALNTGFNTARGQLLTWISADNYCAPHFLETFVSAFNNHPEAGFAYSAFAWINEDGQITGVHQNQDVSWTNMIKANPGIASFMYRKECHETLGWYDPDLEGAEDWDMWLRIIEHYKATYVSDVVCYYRLHKDSMTATKKSLIEMSSEKTKIKAMERQKVHTSRLADVQHVTPKATVLHPSDWEAPLGYSFCIITNGKRLAKLRAELSSIRALSIPNYEILIAGELPPGMEAEGFTFYPLPEAAHNGRLGELRNLLCAKARYNHLVVCDDDMLFQDDFYQGLASFGEDYDVLCVKLLNVDGTRYWSWATFGGPKGHVLLEYNETDPFLYVTGGLCIMKSWVAEKVQWDPVRGMNELEDVDFSRRLQAAGIRINLCLDAAVVHNDWRITQAGKQVFRIDVDFEKVAAFFFSQSWDDGMNFISRVFKVFPGNTELKQRITAFAASYRIASSNAASIDSAPGCTIASRYLHHSAERDLLGTHIQYLREIQNTLLDNRQDTGRNMLLRAESSFDEDARLLAVAGVLSILAGLNQLAVHFIERSSDYRTGNPQTVMYALIASLHVSNSPVIQERLKQHLQKFPHLNGELDIDRLLNFITVTLHDVEYVALGMPPQQISFIQKGAQAAVETRWDETIAYYKQALEATDASELFEKPLHTKISFLDNTLNQEISVGPASETVIPASVSRLCTESEFAEAEYKKLCDELQIAPNHYHRKCWEYYFVAKGVNAAGLLREGTRGICFGAGREILISYFARHGCNITATDLEPDEMTKANWMDTNQHADSLADLLYPQICPPDLFYSHVDFQYADMNSISDSFMQEQYDFSWSCCAFEHLGSIEQGKQFILNQMKCLKPGGVALHTTEFNIMSDVLTIDNTPTVLFRKCDIEEIARQLRNDGHTIEINYSAGVGCVDGYVDIPPYMQKADSWHLRLLLNKYIITSIGLFITKAT